MSDFSELFSPKSDPKHLTPAMFLAKEEQAMKNAIVRMPAPVQQFLDVTVSSVATLASAAAAVEGNAVAGQVAAAAPKLESLFVNFIARIVGAKSAAEVAALAATPAGQSAIQQATTAAAALVSHMGAQVSAGIVNAEIAILPTDSSAH